jgi:hypothetical protein
MGRDVSTNPIDENEEASMRRGWVTGTLGLVVLLTWVLSPSGARAAASECVTPRVTVTISIGISYCMDPIFDPVIRSQVGKIRKDMKAPRDAGKLLAYSSVPISPRGGGHTDTNVDIAAAVKARLEKEYGGGVWVLNPALYQLPDVAGKAAGGGEYMVMWTTVIAGEDGGGRACDMVHFLGPSDVRRFMGCRTAVVPCVERYLAARASTDAKFRADVADRPERRREYVRFYSVRGSAAYSAGAHDEWNIFVRINRKLAIGDRVAMYFDGRPLSLAESEMEVSGGYELIP